MKYAISLLRVEKPEYKKERYETFEEALKVLNKIPQKTRGDFGVAEIHTEAEVKAMEKKALKEQEK